MTKVHVEIDYYDLIRMIRHNGNAMGVLLGLKIIGINNKAMQEVISNLEEDYDILTRLKLIRSAKDEPMD